MGRPWPPRPLRLRRPWIMITSAGSLLTQDAVIFCSSETDHEAVISAPFIPWPKVVGDKGKSCLPESNVGVGRSGSFKAVDNYLFVRPWLHTVLLYTVFWLSKACHWQSIFHSFHEVLPEHMKSTMDFFFSCGKVNSILRTSVPSVHAYTFWRGMLSKSLHMVEDRRRARRLAPHNSNRGSVRRLISVQLWSWK